MLRRTLIALCALALPLTAARAADTDHPKKLLLITDSGGFVHDSVGLAEKLLTELGPKRGWEVTCFRFTRDPNAKTTVNAKDDKGKDIVGPDGKPKKVEVSVLEEYAGRFKKITGVAVDSEHMGHVNRETLKNFDAVLFFTTGNPMTKEETKELVEWVKAGHAYVGTHCATDTLYGEPAYGEMVGGYFDAHPWTSGTKIRLVVEDPKHPAGAPFVSDTAIQDEIYQFKTPYTRERLHIILKLDTGSVKMDLPNIKRKDGDFAISWCQEFGKGKSFYTSLGHNKAVWNDPRFQDHLFAGLDWAVGRVKGDSTPSAKK